MKVLVTGATGLLGRTTAERLLARGDDVRVMQRRPSALRCDETLGDITDVAAVRHAVTGCDAVIHLAARVGVVGGWDEFEAVNVIGTMNLLEAAAITGAGRFVHVSSPSVAHHGDALVGAPATPAAPDRVRGHYARSKALAELSALEAAGQPMAVAVIRPHLVWGPGDTQLVGRIVARARQGRLATVGSGMALIDTTYITNAASALVAALDRAPAIDGEPLVVSNAQPRPVAEMVARILRAAGVPPPSIRIPAAMARAAGAAIEQVWLRTGRRGEPPLTAFLAEQLSTAHWFDQRRTQQALGWFPEVSLDDGFAELAAWFAANRDPAATTMAGAG